MPPAILSAAFLSLSSCIGDHAMLSERAVHSKIRVCPRAGPNRETLSAVLRHILLDDAETSTHLSYVFASITCDEESKKALGHSEFVGALMHMAGSDDDMQQANAARAVANLASSKELRKLLQEMSDGDHGVMNTLFRLAQSKHQPTSQPALQALERLHADRTPLTAGVVPAPNPTAPAAGLDLGGITTVDESAIEFKGRLGAGAFGEVFHGKWRGSDVAVKCMFKEQVLGGGVQSAELLEDFRNEVWLLQNLRHPNIVLLMGTVVVPPRLCIISELCPRGSLHRILHTHLDRQIPWRTRIAMAQDAARGCNFLHTHEPCIVHLDLKSANLVVDKHVSATTLLQQRISVSALRCVNRCQFYGVFV